MPEINGHSVAPSKRIAIVGGGLVGSLNACFFAQKGFHVDLYESRADIRTATKVAGRSINLALSHRGRAALRAVGLEGHITTEGIPMYARMIHDLDGSTHAVPYGTRPDHFIISIDRRRLNEVMLNMAEKFPLVKFHFNHRLVKCNLESGDMTFSISGGATVEHTADLVIGCDGAHSAVRGVMEKKILFDFKQEYIEHGYVELETPADKSGDYAMAKNYLHIWPRDTFMLIALPNLDRSFTTTLFMPFKQFDQLTTETAVTNFFRATFPDAVKLIGENHLVKSFMDTKPSSLISVKCKPYHSGRAVIMGDAAHAMVPFYGQGMNAGFLDCLMFHELMDQYNDNFDLVLPAFTKMMQPNGEAIVDLAAYNYIEMRHLVNTWSYYFRKKMDNFLYRLMPNSWVPRYTMVTFTLTPYSKCIEHRDWQDKMLTRAAWIGGTTIVAMALCAVLPLAQMEDYLEHSTRIGRTFSRVVRGTKSHLGYSQFFLRHAWRYSN
ncbi:Kynurenine 3-monooxygenase [Hypsibius exemplaris]|uniref:Kynurenine 3-monooxygenase n=1 Tax=Hypsibius exemplaris TaxID=2072580 RepID=A0A1W0WL30_HYPEX|nr:Kynurenine 3-monooxygenase [Hypsibius exemplaris]